MYDITGYVVRDITDLQEPCKIDTVRCLWAQTTMENLLTMLSVSWVQHVARRKVTLSAQTSGNAFAVECGDVHGRLRFACNLT